jgi:hypothetical protein
MMATAEIMVFKTMEGDFSFREVMRDQDGDICGIAPFDAAPMGETLEGLAHDIGLFLKALEMPYLAEEDLEFDEDQDAELVEVYKDTGGSNVH